jgi:hypothetical protein
VQQCGGAEEVPALSYQSDLIKTLGKNFTPSCFGVNAEVKSEPVSVHLRELVVLVCLIRRSWWVGLLSGYVKRVGFRRVGLSTAFLSSVDPVVLRQTFSQDLGTL